MEVRAVVGSGAQVRVGNNHLRVVWVKPQSLSAAGEFAVDVDDFVAACEHVLKHSEETG